jgi:hypothetical protein
MLYRVHLVSAGFELTTLEVIGTNYIGSYKSKTVFLIDHAWKEEKLEDTHVP